MKKSYLITCSLVAVACMALGWFALPNAGSLSGLEPQAGQVEIVSEVEVEPHAGEAREVSKVDSVDVEALSEKLVEMPYDEAREVILTEGWQPVPNRNANDLMFVTRAMYEAGYVEVDVCAPTGTAPCSFYFQHGLDYLKVATNNEVPQVVRLEIQKADVEGLNPFAPPPEPLDLNGLRK